MQWGARRLCERVDDADTIELSEIAVVGEDVADAVLTHERNNIGVAHKVAGGAGFGTGLCERFDEPLSLRSSADVGLTHQFSDVM